MALARTGVLAVGAVLVVAVPLLFLSRQGLLTSRAARARDSDGVRLVSVDKVLTEGAVEIFLPQSAHWTSLINGSLDTQAATAVCASIGYPDTQPHVYSTWLGSSSSLDGLNCSSDRQQHVSQCALGSPLNFSTAHAGVQCFGCGGFLTSEKGDVRVLPMTAGNDDCMYVIRPPGQAGLYKFWVDKLTLSTGDFIDVREAPSRHAVPISQGSSWQGLITFRQELYVRVKTLALAGRRADLHWAPVTLETVTSLRCTDDVMQIRVSLSELSLLYNDTDPAYLSLLKESCNGRAIGDTWSIDNPHTDCYTQRQITGNSVQYKNALIYKETGAGPIVREYRWRLDLQCNIKRQTRVGMEYRLTEMKNYEVTLKSDYEAEIHLYNDSSLHTEPLNNQSQVRLGDDLYVHIEVKGRWKVMMRLQQCVAKPQPQSLISYTLIEDGCPTDEQTYIIYQTPNSTLFHFQAFEFYSGIGTVYIECHVVYCPPHNGSSLCTKNCH